MTSQWPSMSCLCAQCRRCCCSQSLYDEEREKYDVWVRRDSLNSYSSYYRVEERDLRPTKSLKDLAASEQSSSSSSQRFFPKKVRLGITTVYGSTQSLLSSDLIQAHEAIWQLKESVPRLASAVSQPIAASSEGYNFICNCDEKRSQSCDPIFLKSGTNKRGILKDKTVKESSLISKSSTKTQTKQNERKSSNEQNSRFSRNNRSRRSLHDFAQSFRSKMSRGFKQVFNKRNGGGRYV